MLICKRKEKKKKKKVSGTDGVAVDVAQQERSNNKCYALAIRYIYRIDGKGNFGKE